MKNVFTINREDVQRIAMKKLGRKLTTEEIKRVKKGVEFGLECWEEVVNYAIKEVMEENKG